MSSNPSTSTASDNRMSWLNPAVILLPIFIGFLRAAPFVPFVAMFLGPEFGMTNEHPAPNAWALAAVSAIGFWVARWLPKRVRDPRASNLLLLLIGILCWIGWMALEPHWHIGDVLRNPISIVSGNGHFGWTLMLTLVFWVVTLGVALDEREQTPEGVRGIMVRSLVFLFIAVLLAGIMGGEIGDAGLSAGYIALPVGLVSGVGAVGLAEMISTRHDARRRGATVPGWDRWGRTFLGTALLIVLITFVAAILFGPGFLALVMDTLATIWSGIATVILWIMYGVVYALYWIVRSVIWLLNLVFDANVEQVEMPQMAEPAPLEEGEPAEQGETEPWRYAALLRFGGIVALVIVAFMIITRFIRYRQGDEAADPNEERSSVFSGSLLRKQISNLFRRRSHGDRPRKLNLASDPASVRESMLYLQVLAARLDTARKSHETPHDFTRRLATQWPQLEAPLNEIRRRYETVRYGESEEDRAAVIAAWQTIWSAHQESPGATG